MIGASSRAVSKSLNTLFQHGAAGPLSDQDLLERFVCGGGEAAEAAFAVLVARHGAMVLGVCRRVLGNRHAAEDAFQATFFVLARKAAGIARREQLACWLHGVARRAALDARARAARQRTREKRLGAMSNFNRPDPVESSELRAILDEELSRLPERHRAAILLCELEGLSRREAAGRLGVSEGTLSSRLARAKNRLRDRLTHRGLALSAAALASALTADAHAVTVPSMLADSTVRIASLVSSGSSLTGVIPTSVATLTEGVLKAMLLGKLKLVVLGLATVALLTSGVGVGAQFQDGKPSDDDRLQAVERKLDRLLEVLGGSQNGGPASTLRGRRDTRSSARPGTPVAAPEVIPPATPAPPVMAALPQPIAPETPQAPQAVAVPPVPPVPPLAPIVAQPPPGRTQRGRMPGAARAVPAQSHSLDARVESLERRLNALEQAFAALEGRLRGVSSSNFVGHSSSGLPRPSGSKPPAYVVQPDPAAAQPGGPPHPELPAPGPSASADNRTSPVPLPPPGSPPSADSRPSDVPPPPHGTGPDAVPSVGGAPQPQAAPTPDEGPSLELDRAAPATASPDARPATPF